MRLLLLLLLVTTCCVAQQRSSRPVPLTRYSDRDASFSYPSVWVHSELAPQYMAPAFTSPVAGASEPLKPRVSVVFSPQGNLYEHTLLLGLVFSYFVLPAKDSAACVDDAKRSSGGASKPAFALSGVRFQEVDGSNAGMCHAQSTQIAVTYREGKCMVFERDFNTECEGAGDGKRKLTPQETRALQRHLDQAMGSVRLGR